MWGIFDPQTSTARAGCNSVSDSLNRSLTVRGERARCVCLRKRQDTENVRTIVPARAYGKGRIAPHYSQAVRYGPVVQNLLVCSKLILKSLARLSG